MTGTNRSSVAILDRRPTMALILERFRTDLSEIRGDRQSNKAKSNPLRAKSVRRKEPKQVAIERKQMHCGKPASCRVPTYRAEISRRFGDDLFSLPLDRSNLQTSVNRTKQDPVERKELSLLSLPCKLERPLIGACSRKFHSFRKG